MKIKKFRGLLILLFVVGIYMLIWAVKGQPLITKIGKSWMFTYSTKIKIDDKDLTDTDIKKIKRFEWAEEADFTFRQINDLDYISNMKRLKSLLIGVYASTNITDWSDISNCSSIETLYVGGGELHNISDLSNLKKLKSLSLEWAREGAEIDLKNISELSSLEYLIIEGYNIKNASELNKVTSLKSIIVKGRAKDFILSCPAENLKILCYSDYENSEIDAKDLLVYTKLEHLSIHKARINNIELLLNLENIKNISVDEELYSNEELMFLKNNGISINEDSNLY